MLFPFFVVLNLLHPLLLYGIERCRILGWIRGTSAGSTINQSASWTEFVAWIMSTATDSTVLQRKLSDDSNASIRTFFFCLSAHKPPESRRTDSVAPCWVRFYVGLLLLVIWLGFIARSEDSGKPPVRHLHEQPEFGRLLLFASDHDVHSRQCLTWLVASFCVMLHYTLTTMYNNTSNMRVS